MPKASCQIDERGGRTGRSTFLSTVAARNVGFLAGVAAAGAPRDPLCAGRYHAVAANLARRLDRFAQLRPQLLYHHH